MITGRRKRAVARVQLKPGTGQIIVNGRKVDEYFPRPSLQSMIQEPFKATQTLGRFDCIAHVAGGGIAGQASALRHGLARALGATDENLRVLLRKSSFLTRDSRVRERKKYGQKGARKRFQWTKR
ncbi:MAG: 30S ribosomal protein S9 [Candidatus Omnitrophica bacterium]|nr:30S ribosomal protein S9 [Candidatus Omnitrophota bacterium]